MDQTDLKIISILQHNGRITMKELANEVSLSPPAAAERVKKLEDADIIKYYRAVINNERIGKPISVLINASIKPENQKDFIKFAENSEEIEKCYYVTGPHTMIIKAHLREMAHLEELVREIQSFGDTETHIIMSSPIDR